MPAATRVLADSLADLEERHTRWQRRLALMAGTLPPPRQSPLLEPHSPNFTDVYLVTDLSDYDLLNVIRTRQLTDEYVRFFSYQVKLHSLAERTHTRCNGCRLLINTCHVEPHPVSRCIADALIFSFGSFLLLDHVLLYCIEC